ncbi:hypothetical protein [Stutzerimonas nitrititolerans]|uniref:hypothetical protein n=1 Tax=Stutzerimonas nitrititolerans TaxID=2482751 RepID=UPI0028A8891F|nr:hypothetical protein [Stutzerimonas nitrititolerans]
MISSEQQSSLAVALCATAEAMGQTMSPNAAKIMAQDLARFSLETIRSALLECRRTLTGRLTLAAIHNQIHSLDGRPEPNEAWAIALNAEDENNSVVLTEEVLLALGAARPVLSAGDAVGARMAFLSAYQRLVDENRRQAIPPKWQLSQGYAADRRKQAISDAVRLGRLTEPHAQHLALQLAHIPNQPNDLQAPALLGLSDSSLPDQEARRYLSTLRSMLKRCKSATF